MSKLKSVVNLPCRKSRQSSTVFPCAKVGCLYLWEWAIAEVVEEKGK